jgi:hypothetical protein
LPRVHLSYNLGSFCRIVVIFLYFLIKIYNIFGCNVNSEIKTGACSFENACHRCFESFICFARPGELSLEIFEEARSSAKERMEAVERLNCSINDIMIEQEANEEVIEAGMRDQEVVRLDAQVKLCGLCSVSPEDEVLPEAHESRSVSVRQDTTTVQAFHIKRTKVTLPTFCDNDKYAFAFKNLLAHFQNAVGSNLSISDKQKDDLFKECSGRASFSVGLVAFCFG